MTDPLARIEAVIATLGRQEADFWTPLDGSEGQVSNAEGQENCGFGHFGHLGHLRGKPLEADPIEREDSIADGGVDEHRGSRASSLVPTGVQSVQSVKSESSPLQIKTLALDT